MNSFPSQFISFPIEKREYYPASTKNHMNSKVGNNIQFQEQLKFNQREFGNIIPNTNILTVNLGKENLSSKGNFPKGQNYSEGFFFKSDFQMDQGQKNCLFQNVNCNFEDQNQFKNEDEKLSLDLDKNSFMNYLRGLSDEPGGYIYMVLGKSNELKDEYKVFDGVVDFLKEARRKGYKNILLSASQIEALRTQLKELEIDEEFYLKEYKKVKYVSKKEKELILKLVEKDKDSKDCIMLGDIDHDYEVAKQMNVECILIAKGHQSRKVLEKCGCRIVDDILEVEI